jgi:hypothetical protein
MKVISIDSRRVTLPEEPKVIQLQCGAKGCGNRTFIIQIDIDDEGDEFHTVICAACGSAALEVMSDNIEFMTDDDDPKSNE